MATDRRLMAITFQGSLSFRPTFVVSTHLVDGVFKKKKESPENYSSTLLNELCVSCQFFVTGYLFFFYSPLSRVTPERTNGWKSCFCDALQISRSSALTRLLTRTQDGAFCSFRRMLLLLTRLGISPLDGRAPLIFFLFI